MKQLLVTLLFLSSTSVWAQDVIVKKDGSTILSKVLEVNIADVKYKKFSNPNGPTYTISKFEIMAINYENGDKDTFESDNLVTTSKASTKSSRLIEKQADSRNEEIINLYNRYYAPGRKVSKKNSLAKHFIEIFGVKSSSIMSNEDIEMMFIRKMELNPNPGASDYPAYYIYIKNKSDRTIYIDKGNCFSIYSHGGFYCYYDNTEQTTVNIGGGSGASLGLGSVAGVLGVSGAVGQLAGGIGVSGGSNHSVSKTYSSQRVIAIPPHAKKYLTEEKWVKTKKGNILSDAEYERIESAEHFTVYGLHQNINKGEVKIFKENESPWERKYIITYSLEEDFSSYSTLTTEMYLREIIGCHDVLLWNSKPHENYIDGLNEYTIESYY